jgi:hypothetical protein
MSETQLDERELDGKEIGQRELAERELADKLVSFAKAVTGGEPDSTILRMLREFESSDPPSEDTLRVCMAHSRVIALSSARHGSRTCERSSGTIAVAGLFATHI